MASLTVVTADGRSHDEMRASFLESGDAKQLQTAVLVTVATSAVQSSQRAEEASITSKKVCNLVGGRFFGLVVLAAAAAFIWGDVTFFQKPQGDGWLIYYEIAFTLNALLGLFCGCMFCLYGCPSN